MDTPFRRWIERHEEVIWPHLPLTHVTRAVFAEKILATGELRPERCPVFSEDLTYTFYGRPAYRATSDQVIQLEASCPCCFIFEAQLMSSASRVHAFDTGAFSKRLFNHVLDAGLQIADFALDPDPNAANRLISAAFPAQEAYFEADRSNLTSPEEGADPWELQGRSYLALLKAQGRNEPDDRICTIEATFAETISLKENLRALVVPHTFWSEKGRSPQLQAYADTGVEIGTYRFIPGRPPEHYHTLLEQSVRRLYEIWKYL
jgi:hypothetical protein